MKIKKIFGLLLSVWIKFWQKKNENILENMTYDCVLKDEIEKKNNLEKCKHIFPK